MNNWKCLLCVHVIMMLFDRNHQHSRHGSVHCVVLSHVLMMLFDRNNRKCSLCGTESCSDVFDRNNWNSRHGSVCCVVLCQFV